MKKHITLLLAVLIALARFATPSHAAAMTGKVAVTGSGGGPFTITYYLVQNVTSLQVKIKNASGGAVVKTMDPITTGPQLTAGLHNAANNPVIWDGSTDANNTPAAIATQTGNYYAEITTTAAAQTTKIAKLLGGVALTDPLDSARNNGRWTYNPAVNRDSTSFRHNRAYLASCAAGGNANQLSGIIVADVDLTAAVSKHNSTITGNSDLTSTDWLGVGLTSDGYALLGGQSSHKVPMLNPDFSAVTIFPRGTSSANTVNTRTVQVFGTGAAPRYYFIDNGTTTGSTNGGAVSYLDLSQTNTPTPTVVVKTTDFSGSGQSFVINKNETTCWITEVSTTLANQKIEKYTRASGTGPGPGATAWVKDATFVFALPGTYTTTTQIRGIALSPDESVLWYTISDAANSTTLTLKQLVGLNAGTGASLGSNYQITAADSGLGWGNPTGIAVTDSGNIYLQGFSATYGTQTTSATLYLFSPPDSGSTDVTPSPPFPAGATFVTITGGPSVATTYQSATVTWTTDITSDSTVQYATVSGGPYTSAAPSPNTPGTSHSVSIPGLDQNKTYYYRVVSAVPGLTSGISAESTFKTNALLVSGFGITANENSATITWTTSEAANSTVVFGLSSGTYYKTVSDATMTTGHTVLLGSLKTNLRYFFVARSGSGAPGTTDSAFPEGDFTTHSSSMSNTKIATTPTSATITFDTDGTPDAPAAATLNWGTSTSPATVVPDTGAGNSHTFVITGLSPGTTYYYIVTLSGATIPTRTSPTCAFTTPAVAPASVVTQSTAASAALANSVNLAPAADNAIATLARQGLPGTPVSSTLPVKRYYSGVVASNGYLYCIGGRDEAYTGLSPFTNSSKGTVLSAPINPDGSVGTWVDNPANDLPSGSERACINNQCFAYNGYIYVVGGLNVSLASQTTVLYTKQDPATGNFVSPTGSGAVWQTTTALPTTVYLGSATTADGFVLVTGGFTTGVSTQAYMNRIRPDGTLGTWYATRSLSETESYHRTMVNNHTVYLVGGQENPGFRLYNTANIATTQPNRDLTPFWKNTNDPDFTSGIMDNPGTPPDSGRWSMGSAIVRGKILLAAGRLNNGASATGTTVISTGKLAPTGQVNGWVASGSAYPAALFELDGAVYNGSFYGIGGRTTTASSTASNAVVRIPFVDDTGYAYSGTYESNYIDLTGANSLTSLRHIKVSGTGINSSSVELRYRYCGVDAASVFTEWQATDGPDVDISGGARYIQYQLVLKGDGTSTPVVSGVTITTGTTADLSISNFTVDNPSPNPGGTVVYTAIVSNNGPDAAPGVVLTDNLPAGLTFVSASGGTVGGTATSPTVTIDNIPSGSTATVTITATVNAGTAGQTISNPVSDSFAGTDSSPSNDTATANITVNAPVAISSAAVTPGYTTSNRQVTISVGVAPGTNPVAGVVADLSPIGGSPTQALSNGGSGNTYSYLATVAAGTVDGAKTINVIATDSIDGMSATGSATVTVVTPVVIDSVTFVPPSVKAGETTTITATVTPGTNAVASVTADLTPIGGSATQALSNGGSGNVYSYTATVDPATSSALKTINVLATDAVDGLTATSSATLDVLNATQLAFTTQPGPGVKADPLSVQPVVKIEAANGDVAANYTGPVTIAIKPGTGTPGAVLGGTTTVNAVAGVVNFTDLSIDLVGTGYVLTATAPDLSLSVDSNAIAIKDVPLGPWGDVDQDGFVTLADADLVHTYLTDPASLSDEQKERIVRYGDIAGTHNVNVVGDGTTDVNDLVRIARIAGGMLDPGTAGPAYPSYGDVDGDGVVTLSDAVVVARYIGGLETDPTLVTRITTAGIGDVWPTSQKITFGDGQITADDETLIRQRAMGAETTPPAYKDYWPLVPGDQYTLTDLNHRSGDSNGQTTFTTADPSGLANYPFDARGYMVSDVSGNDGASAAGVFKGINGSIYALYVEFPFFSAKRMDFQSPMKVLDTTQLTPGASWSGDLLGTMTDIGLRPVHYKVTVLRVGNSFTPAAGSYPTDPGGIYSTWSDTVSIRIDIAVLAGLNNPIEMQQAIFFDFANGIGPVRRGQAAIQDSAAPTNDRPFLELDSATVRGITYDPTHPAF